MPKFEGFGTPGFVAYFMDCKPCGTRNQLKKDTGSHVEGRCPKCGRILRTKKENHE